MQVLAVRLRIVALAAPSGAPPEVDGGAQEYTYQRLLELVWQNEFVSASEQERLEVDKPAPAPKRRAKKS